MEIRKTSQAAPVKSNDKNGRTMRPFSFRRIPRLTFVSCQPMRRRSKKPSLREGMENGPGPLDDGTVGEGDHIGIAEPSGPGYINPSEERPSREAPILLRRESDLVRMHSRENAPRRDEKLLKKMANTRARQPDETLVACVEEARKDALEVAQEADAPPQARAEDASTLTHWRSFPTVRIRGSRFIVPGGCGPSSWRTSRSSGGMPAS